jgi:hypothetical protein
MIRVLSLARLTRVYPRRDRWKRPALLVVVSAAVVAVASGCGGGGKGAATTQSLSGKPVVGTGFDFRTPSDWTATVTQTSATAKAGDVMLVSVTVLPLVKAYRVSLFPKVVGELDRLAGTLAARLNGKVVAGRTTTVGGRRVRQYDIAHGGLVDRLTFVLRAKTEYLLTCRWRKADGEPSACSLLLRSFRLR